MYSHTLVQVFCAGLCLGSLQVNGLLWDQPPPRIYSLHIRSDIQYRFATTLVTSRVVNPANHTQDTLFDVTLPDEAFITNFTLEIDGVVYPGIVKDKDEAKKDYDKARKKGQSAGLVSQRPRDSKRFKVEIAIAAESKVTFNLTYQELLKRTKGQYEHKIFINPGQPVEDLQISVGIVESRDITSFSVPPLRAFKDLLTNEIVTGDLPANEPLAVVSRPTPKSASVTYSPTAADQSDEGLSGQFVVQYDVERSFDGGDVLVVNGYFVHFLAPTIEKAISKDVLFIVDVSGSMSGTKIVQARDSMYSILDQLEEGDRFNIIKFDDVITPYIKDDMMAVTKESIQSGKRWVHDELHANGWTDINSAMLKGIDMVRRFKIDGERSPLILFLTDGQPSSGVTNDIDILQNIQRANEGDVPVFSLAFGKDADWKLLKKMSAQNDGVARLIYEDSDADLQIAGFYDELSVTLLNNVTFKYIGDSVDDKSLTKATFKNYFQGSELVVAGKLADSAGPTVKLEILGDSAEGNFFLMDSDANILTPTSTNLMSAEDFSKITEKLWAYLTIKQLLHGADGQMNGTIAAMLKERAKSLALQYGFVTSLTSLVVVKPDIIDDRPTTPAPTTTTTTRRPRRYGGGGGGGGGWGGGGGGDPHYMVRVGSVEHPLCFDVPSERDGEVHNLISDKRHGITIKSQVVVSDKLNRHGEPKTFIGQLSIQTKHHIIVVTPDAILFDTKMFAWDKEKIKMFGGHEMLLLDKGRLLSIRFKFGAEILIKRHHPHIDDKAGVSFLNFYVYNEDGFSPQATGLIGQFVNGNKHILLRKEHDQPTSGKHMGKFQVREGPKFLETQLQVPVDKPERHVIRASLIDRSDVIAKETEKCWMVHREYEKLLYGDVSTYVVRDFVDL